MVRVHLPWSGLFTLIAILLCHTGVSAQPRPRRATARTVDIALTLHRLDKRLPTNAYISFRPGDEVFPVKEDIKGIPATLHDVQLNHEFLDSEQFLFQTMRAGIVTRERYNQLFATMDTSALSPQWMDCIFSSVTGRDDHDSLVVVIDTNNNNDFSDEHPLHFEAAEMDLEGQGILTPIMKAVTEVAFDYSEDGTVKTTSVPTRIFYTEKGGEYSWYRSVDAYRRGQWSVAGTTYEVALWNPGGAYRPADYRFLYVDLDRDGVFDPGPDGLEAYPLTSFFNIGGATWRVGQLKVDGSMIQLVESDSLIAPRVALRKGTPAPDFTGVTLEGHPIPLRAFRGRYVLLDFWGPWCGPCLKEIPYLKAAYAAMDHSRFSIVGICYTGDEQGARAAVREYDIPWPQIFQQIDGDIQKAYRVVGWPSQWLIDPNGIIVETGVALRGDRLMKTLEIISKPIDRR